MAIPQGRDVDFLSTSRIQNLPDGVANQEPATVAQLNAAINGLKDKGTARVASTANVTLSSPGTTIDAITMAAGDRVLLKNQTAAAENGIWIWNASASAMTRALDMDVAKEVEAAVVTIEEGTANAGTTWRQTAVNVTLGTTSLGWVAFGGSAGAASETSSGIAEIATQAETDAGTDDLRFITPLKLKTSPLLLKKYETTIGDNSSTSFVVTHNIGTVYVHVTVFEIGGSKREFNTEVQHTSTNSVTILVSPAPASGALGVLVSQ